jgi:hypothetical protein
MAVHRDAANETRMEDLNSDNKKMAKKIRNALRTDQERLDADRKKEKKLTDQEVSETRMKQTQLNSQSKVRIIGQEEIVSCSSDCPTRWLYMKKTCNIV